MATQDDDTLTGSVPDPEAAATPAELAHARRFSELVDKTLAGRTPPAMSAEDRALLEVATVLRAARGHLELAPSRRHALIEDVLRQAIGGGPAAGGSVAPSMQLGQLGHARARRWAPWIVAGASALVAAAALALVWLRPLPAPRQAVRGPAPVEWRSRPADSLIGPIARDHAGDASARLDAIFADRLDGFRARRLAQRGEP